eukprot:CAMPEP_0197022370 /NCGR_PEP_ID=MMETSP1384-20130603/3285_1 /TAXON_ID=29189 /ORGANISM="Ammonia sp." /LENGTH=386 /DNA_ID=CAMNT_0042450407 /DNA_START=31 /DNA_END=1191 /DNA_ORIENTATION=-
MANLQEEIFESEDFKELEDAKDDDNQNEKPNEEPATSTNVIEEQIAPSKAFQIYAGQLYDPSSSSARVYDTTQSADRNFESPLQTYKRLQFEIQQFKDTLQEISDKAQKEQQDPTKQITQQLSQQLNELWSNVEAFKNDPQIAGLFAEANNALIDTVSADYLFKRLQEFQAQKMGGDDTKDDGQGADSKAVFTLYHDGSMNNQTYRMKEIHDRLANLEKIIGPKPDNPTIGDMTRSVEYLSSVLSLLSDDMKLDGLVRRAQVLRKKLQEIQAKGHAAIELQITKTKEEKINKLFDMMTRWDQAALQLPTIVSRLRSVKNLHEESANIVQKVNRLETQNQLIQKSLESNQNILNNVTKSLQENATTMQNNMRLIQERLDKINQKLNL